MDNKKRSIKIMVIGPKSSGTSSYIDSFVVEFVSKKSPHRPVLYTLKLNQKAFRSDMKNVSATLETLEKENNNNTLIVLADYHNPFTLYHKFDRDVILLDCSNDEKIFDDNLDTTDIVVYVTDTTHCFQKESEVEQFQKLKGKITDKISKGYYIDLIIIVNKCEDGAYSLVKDMHKNIRKKGITNRFFKYSSHKVLIHKAQEYKQKLYIPHSKKKEFLNVLKHADVKLTDKIMENFNTHENISFDPIIFEYDSYIYDIYGDPDKHFEYLKNRINCIDINILDTLTECIKQWINKIEHNNNEIKLIKYYDELYEYQKIYQNKQINFDDTLEYIVQKLLHIISGSDINNEYPIQQTYEKYTEHMLLMLYQYVCIHNLQNDNIIAQIIDTFISHHKKFNHVAHIQIIYYSLKYYNNTSIKKLFSMEYLEHVLLMEDIYMDFKRNPSIWTYNMKTKELENPLKESLATFIINNKYAPCNIKILLQLSTLDLVQLKTIHETCKINQKYMNALKTIRSDYVEVISYIINRASTMLTTLKFPLHEEFFKLAQYAQVQEFIKQYSIMQIHLL